MVVVVSLARSYNISGIMSRIKMPLKLTPRGIH
jgi:hypothetical protein